MVVCVVVNIVIRLAQRRVFSEELQFVFGLMLKDSDRRLIFALKLKDRNRRITSDLKLKDYNSE